MWRIKVLPKDFAADPDWLRGGEQEAMTLATFIHLERQRGLKSIAALLEGFLPVTPFDDMLTP